MTKKALIYDTRICEVRDEVFEVSSDLQWVDVADDTVASIDTYVDGAVVKYIDPVLTWHDLRRKRNNLLDFSDWTQGNDSPLSDEVKASWATYRQLLRDLPEATVDPDNPTWPEAPE